MKVGDLVRFRSAWPGGHGAGPLGIITLAALATLSSPARYKIWWMAQNKTGWWDSHKLERVE